MVGGSLVPLYIRPWPLGPADDNMEFALIPCEEQSGSIQTQVQKLTLVSCTQKSNRNVNALYNVYRIIHM